jgi:predicted metal-dependent phosphoesterase TrpH
MRFDLHIHSVYSYDSLLRIPTIMKTAQRLGLDAIAITDHETMGAYATLRPQSDLTIIPGMEIKTDKGDVIGLFLSAEIQSRDFCEVIDEIRDQDGLVVLPHPFRRSCDPDGLVGSADLVEVINSRSRDQENLSAWELCWRAQKLPVTGSDAHTRFEIGRAVTETVEQSRDLDDLKGILLKGDRTCSGDETPYYLAHGCSFLASRVKRVIP